MNNLIIYNGIQNIITDNEINYLDIIWKISNKGIEAEQYIDLIKNAQNKNYKTRDEAKSKEPSGYVENHHIVPRSIGGDNNKLNLIFLTAKEHFIAHKLLSEMFDNKHFQEKMIYALWMLSTTRDDKTILTAEEYEEIKIKYIEILKGHAYWLGRHHSQETKDKISNDRMGEKHHFYGGTHSQETKDKISKAATGQIRSEEYRKNISEAKMGEKNGMFGTTWSDEKRKSFTEKMSGENHPMYGKHHTEEAKEKNRKSSEKRKEKEQKLIKLVDEFLKNNELPTDIIYNKRNNEYFKKLHYAAELIKQGLLSNI
jgi:hypothetical protein